LFRRAFVIAQEFAATRGIGLQNPYRDNLPFGSEFFLPAGSELFKELAFSQEKVRYA